MKDIDAKLNGLDLFGEPVARNVSGPVAEKFYFPPFTFLDARAGEWQNRKRAWIDMGLKSEQGRDVKVYTAGLINRYRATKDKEEGEEATGADTGISIFDPTLCECMYRWFCQPGGQVVDPFAGGSVRGIVAGVLGLRYWGCDLRAEQVASNVAQAAAIAPEVPPVWVCGDSTTSLAAAPAADFVFSCPPYGDLERYSDDPADLSTMSHEGFLAAYRTIIAEAIKRLKDDRFACFVVGDYRDKHGHYTDFVSQTIAAFRAAGAALYNEAILATSVGSARLRVSRQFAAGRKLAKTHQNILIFCKGDWRRAADAIAERQA